MNFSTETIGRLYASGRNYINSGVGLLTGVGLMSAAQNKGLMDALSEIYNGISQVIHGASSAWTILAVLLAPIVTPILSRMASNSAKTSNQAAAVVTAIKDPNTPITPEVKAVVLEAATEVKKI
jgi:hypothetical protein